MNQTAPLIQKMNQKATGNMKNFPIFTAAVEQCLLDGLKRRLLGLFGARSTFALVHNISKYCNQASEIIRLVNEAENDESLCTKYYEKSALMLDAVKGGVVSALLVGPCEFSYSVSIRPEESWPDDPTADELVQRHRLHSISLVCSSPIQSPRRPPLSILRSGSSIVNNVNSCYNPMCIFGRDYVFSLHQNMKTSLLYGKNNVTVTVSPDGPTLKGYFSLHQISKGNLIIKWTPNQLMHSNSQPNAMCVDTTNSEWLWRHAINLNVNDIIYIHVHQNDEESPATLVFVGGDGVQHSPIRFPFGQHAVLFLNCLETGLQPYRRLDPPLWISKDQGKMLPKLRRRTSLPVSAESEKTKVEEYELNDYVFRIVPVFDVAQASNSSDVTESDKSTAECATVSPHITDLKYASERRTESDSVVDKLVKQNLKTACVSMRNQILARLAYTGHLKTIRTHLSALIYDEIVEDDGVYNPVDEQFWRQCREAKNVLSLPFVLLEALHKTMENLFWRKAYLHGIAGDDTCQLRRQTWPYLIKLLNWDEDLEAKVPGLEEQYESDFDAWKKMETKVLARDQEEFTAGKCSRGISGIISVYNQCLGLINTSITTAIMFTTVNNIITYNARLRQRSNSIDLNFPGRGMSMNSDVFDDNDVPLKSTPATTSTSESVNQDPLDSFGTNLHRIQKDVDRCDRHYPFYSKTENREKLKNVLCTYVWRNMEIGYMQGMCDLAAPFLVLYDNEALALVMFECVMRRMRHYFPTGAGMDENLANMRFLIQVMDPELYDVMANNGDFADFYFSYRWFLLDFKRELTYPQLFQVWEVMMAASHIITDHFQLFFALAIVSTYRHIIIDNHMDYADVINNLNFRNG
uniref:Rab-GAP TBC domain-containing protein n=1 Tax=Syphacia muris TaxID=451379 RepID=A0A0N5AVY8_9BILA